MLCNISQNAMRRGGTRTPPGGYPGQVPPLTGYPPGGYLGQVPPRGGVPGSGTPRGGTRVRYPPGGGTRVRYPPGGTRVRYPPWGGTQVRYPPWGGTWVRYPPRGGTQVRYPPGGYSSQVHPRGGTRVRYTPGGVPGSGTPPGGYPGQVPPRGGTRVRYPPGGVPGSGTPPGGYPGRTTEGVLTTRRAVCLLRSRRRTFLLCICYVGWSNKQSNIYRAKVFSLFKWNFFVVVFNFFSFISSPWQFCLQIVQRLISWCLPCVQLDVHTDLMWCAVPVSVQCVNAMVCRI